MKGLLFFSEVVADMEDRGVCLDFEICDIAFRKIHKPLEKRDGTSQ